MPAGLTGPIQLVGRDGISDADRLRLEIAYCRAVAKSYSIWLDLRILFYTVLVGFMPQFRFTPKQVLRLIWQGARSPLAGMASLQPHRLRRTKSFDRDATRR